MTSAYRGLLGSSNSSMDPDTSTRLNASHLDFDPDSSQLYVLTRRFQTVLLPFICVFGIFGNILAVMVLLTPALRRASSCLILAGKSLSDIGFLVSLFVMWLYRIHLPLLNMQGICQTTVFLSYVCGFLSVWFVVVITFENFVRIGKPWKVTTFCTPRKAVVVIVAMVMFSCTLYSFSLWSNGIITEHNPKCQSLAKYRGVALVMTYIDTALTLVLPSVTMVILLVAIMLCVLRGYRRKLRLLAQTANGKSNACTPEGIVSRFLFAVSIIFVFLNAPSHVVRMRLMLVPMPTITDLIIQRLFEIMYYCHFALNCVIYLIFGDNFRRVFRQMYCNKCARKDLADVQVPNTRLLPMQTFNAL